MTTTSEDRPTRLWLNAFSCVRPTDEFAAEVGRDVIRLLMSEGVDKVEALDPFKRLTLEVVCS